MKPQNLYALYVRMHHEKKTAQTLEQMGISYYLPIQEVIRQWSDRKKKVQAVVIPMMIFVHTDNTTRINLMQQIPAITGTLTDRCTHSPAIIRDSDMERFRFMLDFSEQTVSFVNEPLQKGETVEVIKGPLTGLKGELVQLNGKSQVTVRIEQLGCAIVEIPIGYLEKVKV